MLSKRQNLLETIHGGHPDRFVNQYEAFALLFGTPFGVRSRNPKYGEENVVNAWGETCSWPIGTPGPFPVHTPDKIVVKDIEHWQDYVKVPQVVYDAKEWEPFIAEAEKVDRNEQFATAFYAPGVFEMCHHLMSMQSSANTSNPTHCSTTTTGAARSRPSCPRICSASLSSQLL